MGKRHAGGLLKRTLQLGLVLVGVALLIPLLTGRPLVSYPISESMTPTLGPFDVFLVNPYPSHLHVGDIILFGSVTTGQPAVHRIVGGDAKGGWVTKGDANPVEDQMNIEPLVTHDRIMGRVVTGPTGAPITIPKLGHTLTRIHVDMVRIENAMGGADKATFGLVIVCAVGLFVPTLMRTARRAPEHPPTHIMKRRLRALFPRGILGWHVGGALFCLLVVCVGIAMHAASSALTVEVIVVGDAGSADGERAARPGQSVTRDVEVGSLGFLPTIVFLSPASTHLAVPGEGTHVGPWQRTTLHVRDTAGTQRGVQRDDVTVWRYPALMPASWTRALHERMPGLPDLVLGAGVAAVGACWLVALGVARRPVGRDLGLKEVWR